MTARSDPPALTYPLGCVPSPDVYRLYARPPAASFSSVVLHPLVVVGCTQADKVIPVVMSSRLLSATVTQALVPLNDSALPYFPAVVQVALDRVPVRVWPVASAVVVPVPSSNPHAPTRLGLTVLLTVTVTVAEVV